MQSYKEIEYNTSNSTLPVLYANNENVIQAAYIYLFQHHVSSVILISVASSVSFIVALTFIGLMFKYLMKRPTSSTKIQKLDIVQRPQFDIKQQQTKMMK